MEKLSKDRYLQLKYFCLQYPEWKQNLKNECSTLRGSKFNDGVHNKQNVDVVFDLAIRRNSWSQKCKVVESAAKDTDEVLGEYILKAVTENLSYTYLQTVLNIPCGKDLYYDKKKMFFEILDTRISM